MREGAAGSQAANGLELRRSPLPERYDCEAGSYQHKILCEKLSVHCKDWKGRRKNELRGDNDNAQRAKQVQDHQNRGVTGHAIDYQPNRYDYLSKPEQFEVRRTRKKG